MKENKKSPRFDLILEARKNMGLSQEDFIKKLYAFSKGECSIGRISFRKLESGQKTNIDVNMFVWIFRFTKIKPDKFFNI